MYPVKYTWNVKAAPVDQSRPSLFNVGLDSAGVELTHHFGDDGSGVYIKETHIPAGVRLVMHTHTFTHKSVLSAGKVLLTVGDQPAEVVTAPAVLTVYQGEPHSVEAIEPSVWLCIHASDETDPDHIDHAIVGD